MDPIDVAHHALQTLAALLVTGAFVAVLARRLGIPDVVLFLLAGIALGPAGLGLIAVPAASEFNQFVLLLGASWLLFDGGAHVRFAVLKRTWITIVVISTLGVLITAAITAFAAKWLLGLPLLGALLLGAVLAPTDPATLVPIFAQVRIRERVAQTVISESAFNDATGAILTFVVLGFITAATPPTAGSVALAFAREAGIGLVTGAVLGYVIAELVAHERRALFADFAPLAALAGVIMAFSLATALHGSGFMAVFVFGLIFGNRDSFGLRLLSPAEQHLEDFTATAALLLRLMIFTLLGTQIDFALMERVWQPAVGIVLVFMFVARPLTVLVCASPDRQARWTRDELLFMCWTRETGVIPAALAGLLLGQRVPGAETVAAVTFVAILMTILIQATTTRWLARKLGLLAHFGARAHPPQPPHPHR